MKNSIGLAYRNETKSANAIRRDPWRNQSRFSHPNIRTATSNNNTEQTWYIDIIPPFRRDYFIDKMIYFIVYNELLFSR